jgi:hypothetical protein
MEDLAPAPKYLPYQLTQLQIFEELETKNGTEFPFLPEVLKEYRTIRMPLTDAYKEEEIEAKIYNIPFVDNLEGQVGSLVKQNPTKKNNRKWKHQKNINK